MEIAEVLSWLEGTGDGWREAIATEAAGVPPRDKGAGDVRFYDTDPENVPICTT